MSDQPIWKDYLDFAGLTLEEVRPGNAPRYLIDDQPRRHAIVLVHGLTDSPYTLSAVGQYFYEKLGFNVLLPLLAGHGLKEPAGFRNVSMEQWLDQVDYCLDKAHLLAETGTVSIGGLSTGGTLSVHKALFGDKVNGGVFLFSVALRLQGRLGRWDGKLRENLLNLGPVERFFADRQDPNKLIGINPYRYAYMDYDGAAQLVRLIQQIKLAPEDSLLQQPVFAAHSEADQTADIQGVQDFLTKCQNSELFVIGKDFIVPHASLGLSEPVLAANGSPLEPANPFFETMMKAVAQFAESHLAYTGK